MIPAVGLIKHIPHRIKLLTIGFACPSTPPLLCCPSLLRREGIRLPGGLELISSVLPLLLPGKGFRRCLSKLSPQTRAQTRHRLCIACIWQVVRLVYSSCQRARSLDRSRLHSLYFYIGQNNFFWYPARTTEQIAFCVSAYAFTNTWKQSHL